MLGKIKIYKVPFLNEQKSCLDTFKFVKIWKNIILVFISNWNIKKKFLTYLSLHLFGSKYPLWGGLVRELEASRRGTHTELTFIMEPTSFYCQILAGGKVIKEKYFCEMIHLFFSICVKKFVNKRPRHFHMKTHAFQRNTSGFDI